ncbi:MAG TPA: inositol monophosphatase [Phycisphaerae bacterium]|nr:inositol monophosphatase [Phycisphaerae bacterium]
MTDDDLTEWLNIAGKLADEAGRIILERWDTATTQRKADGSEVTDADWAAEEHIRDALNRAYPDHDVLAEEAGLGSAPAHGGRFCWAVDPLDGTQSYTRRFPCFATSIALLDSGTPVVGVVREHVSGRTYTAAAGHGAHMDGAPIRVAQNPLNYDFFVGISSSKHPDSRAALQRVLQRASLRSLGSTAVHLALVATGAMDAALSHRCYTWDIAAGYVIIREAGGVCTDLHGRDLLPLPPQPDPTAKTPFLAAGPHVHAELLDLIRRGAPAD